MKRPTNSYEIALSGIACALATIALTVGAYVNVFYGAGMILAVFALMVPLAKGFPLGSFLAFCGTAIFAFLFSAFAIFRLLPFIVFFGLHPIVNYFQKKYIKKFPLHLPAFLVKAAWFDLTVWLMWSCVLVPVFGVASMWWYEFVAAHFFLVLFAGGTLLFAVYDTLIFFSQRSVDLIIARIKK